MVKRRKGDLCMFLAFVKVTECNKYKEIVLLKQVLGQAVEAAKEAVDGHSFFAGGLHFFEQQCALTCACNKGVFSIAVNLSRSQLLPTLQYFGLKYFQIEGFLVLALQQGPCTRVGTQSPYLVVNIYRAVGPVEATIVFKYFWRRF